MIKGKRIQIVTSEDPASLEEQVNLILDSEPVWEVSPMHVSPGVAGEYSPMFFVTLIMTEYYEDDHDDED